MTKLLTEEDFNYWIDNIITKKLFKTIREEITKIENELLAISPKEDFYERIILEKISKLKVFNSILQITFNKVTGELDV